MERLKIFERALLKKQLGAIGMIVILDIIYLILSPFYGHLSFLGVCAIILLINMLSTCFLYHALLLSKGEVNFELNTEKIVYYPITRTNYLRSKYAKTIILLCIQLILTNLCLWLGEFTARGEMDQARYIGCNLLVCISILSTSGIILIVMHYKPLSIYLSLFIYYPLILLAKGMEYIHYHPELLAFDELVLALLCATFTFVLWLLFLLLGIRIFEKVS
jgi:hypothetical protein